MTVLALGDSLTAGWGLTAGQSYPSVLQRMFLNEGLDVKVVNAGVSGDTSAGGLARLDWNLSGNPDIVVVALGANDGLRGLSPVNLEKNLAEIIRKSRAAGAKVVLAGMYAPPNLGQAYVKQFNSVYPDLADRFSLPLVPFLLEGVATRPELNQPDGIHPNAEGAKVVAENVYKVLYPMVVKELGL